MPKEITHIHIAEKILNALPESVQLILKQNQSSYYFGSIAPDIFYYDVANIKNRTIESRIEWGEIIHGRYGNDTMLHLIYILDQIRANKSDNSRNSTNHRNSILLSFVCGFLTHIAADTIFHPYIYSVTGNYYDQNQTEHKASIARHRLFETCLDQHILKQREISLADFKLNQWFNLNELEKPTILNMYADSLQIANDLHLNSKLMRRIVYRCYRKTCLITQVFQNRPASKVLIKLNRRLNGRLSGAANAVYGDQVVLIPFESLPNTPHPVTGEELKGGNVLNMVNQSIKRGVDFANASFLYVKGQTSLSSLRQKLRPYSLNNGLERVATDDMTYSKIQNWPINPI